MNEQNSLAEWIRDHKDVHVHLKWVHTSPMTYKSIQILNILYTYRSLSAQLPNCRDGECVRVCILTLQVFVLLLVFLII